MQLSCRALTSQPGSFRRWLNSPIDRFQGRPNKVNKWVLKERQKRYTAWSYGKPRGEAKLAFREMHKIFQWNTERLDDEHKNNVHIAKQRVSAACDEHQISYPAFTGMLSQARIGLKARALSHLAIYEPESFKALTDLARKMAIDTGKDVAHGNISTKPSVEHVHIDTEELISKGPLPRDREYQLGPSKNYRSQPRLLERHEY